jgi:methionine-rich copper-binding protein CopC
MLNMYKQPFIKKLLVVCFFLLNLAVWNHAVAETITENFNNSAFSFTNNFTKSTESSGIFAHTSNGGIGDSGQVSIPASSDVIYTTNEKYSMADNGVLTMSVLFHSQYNSGYGSFGFTTAWPSNASGDEGSPSESSIGVSFHAGGGNWLSNNDRSPLTWDSSLDTNTSNAEWYHFELKITDKTNNAFDLEFTISNVNQTTGAITNQLTRHTTTIANENVKTASALYLFVGAEGHRMIGFDDFIIEFNQNVIVNGGLCCGSSQHPTLSSSSPADGATGVGLNANIALTFSEVVDVETGNILIKTTVGNSHVETINVTGSKVTGTGTNTITINPATTLDVSTSYYVTIDATAFDNAASNSYAGISSSTALNFTTSDAPPTMTITSAQVADGATSNDGTLALTFTSSEATADFALSDIRVSGGSLSSFITTSSTVYTATFIPSSNGATTINVAGSTFTDGSGNNNNAATEFNWTYDGTSPSISSVTAGWGASLNQLEDNSTGTVTVVTSGIEDGQTVTLTLNNNDYTSTVSSNSTSISVTASALQALSNNTVYTLTTNVSDAAGNAAAAHMASSFTALNNPASNNALDFDGVNDFVMLGDVHGSLRALTFSAWIYPVSTNNNAVILTKPKLYTLGHDSNGYIKIYFGTGTNWNSTPLVSTHTVSSSQWNHVAVTRDSSNNVVLYINGVASSSSVMTESGNSAQAFTIGAHDGGYISFNGKIDEVRIWSDARTASEISTNMTKELNGDETGLVAYYKFNEPDTGTILSNATTGDFDGALTKMAGTEWTASAAFSTDTTAPTVTSFSSTTSDGSFKQGDTINITANTSENVVSGNALTVTLDTGETVTLAAAAIGKTLVGTYTVGTGVTSSALTVSSFAIFTVADGSGNAMTSTTLPSTNIATGSTLVVDTTATIDAIAPTITFSPASAATNINIDSNITLTLSEAIRNADDSALTETNVDSLITLKSTNSSGANIAFDATINAAKTIITINPSSEFSFQQVVYVAIGTSVEDIAGNTITAANATFTVTSVTDSVPPTIVITAAEETDGNASDDATLLLTFTSSEATTNFASGDITVTNATLSGFSKVSSTVYTATLTPSDEGAVTVDVAAGTFTDAAINNNTAATQFNWTYLVDPTTKKDVIGSIGASIDMASQWTQSTFSVISDRLGWLKSHKGQTNTSYQGIRLDFNDATINTLMAAPTASFMETNWTNAAVNQVNKANDSLSALQNNIGIDLTKAALNKVVIIRQNATGTLNPVFKPILNGWSLWTAGTVAIGNADASSSSSKQSSKAHSISIGIDKPMNDHSLIGFLLRTGQGRADIGTSTSKVKSESYSLSGYRAYEGHNNLSMEAVAGVGVVKYNLTRANGVDTLTGGRIAHQAFTSFTMNKPTTVFGKLSLSPFMKVTYNHTWFGRYSESGGASALTYKEHAINETKLGIGTEARYQLFVGNINVLPYARVSYSLDVSDQANAPAQMYYRSNPSKVYSLALDKRSTGSVQFALGAELITMGGINASLGYRRNTVINSGDSELISLHIGQTF